MYVTSGSDGLLDYRYYTHLYTKPDLASSLTNATKCTHPRPILLDLNRRTFFRDARTTKKLHHVDIEDQLRNRS